MLCRYEILAWPYLIWTRQGKGEDSGKTLNKGQATAVKKAMKEMKQLNLIIERWKVFSLKQVVNELSDSVF